MALTREQILGKASLRRELVLVPEWDDDSGGEPAAVWLRELTAKERDAYEAEIFVIKGSGRKAQVDYQRANIRAKLVALSAIDPSTGGLLFTVEDVGELGSGSAAALDRLFTVAQRLSGFSKGDIEELEKN